LAFEAYDVTKDRLKTEDTIIEWSCAKIELWTETFTE